MENIEKQLAVIDINLNQKISLTTNENAIKPKAKCPVKSPIFISHLHALRACYHSLDC